MAVPDLQTSKKEKGPTIITSIAHMRAAEIIVLAAFSALFALSIVLSNHIAITGDKDAGLITESYITPYEATDAAIFVCLLIATFIVVAFVYLRWAEWGPTLSAPNNAKSEPLQLKPLILSAAVIAILHLPYLLTYYPGFIFGDSLSSIAQATGLANYSNHHPVAYTLIVKACLDFSHALGFSTTTGCALYSLIQTALMALSYATMIQWAMQRASLRRAWRILLVAIFGLTPYIATYSIAMWKDPLFSAAIVVASVLIADLILTGGKIASRSKLWLPVFAICCIAIALLRSNGILIDALLCVALIIYAAKTSPTYRGVKFVTCLIPAIAVAINLLLTGPVYHAFGVTPNEKVEGVGIPLAQMARVVAYDGDMSDSDAEYMNEMLPLEEYANIYSPTLIDSLKWDPQFNPTPLEDGLYEHWFSMLTKNPRVYFEAWEMQTFGFWTVNHPAVVFHTRNISAGVPRTEADPRGIEAYGVTPRNYLGATAQSLLPYENLSIPIGWITWGLLFLCLIVVLSGNGKWLIPLLPSAALLLSLLVASPLWYWERYAAATQFLLPFYLALAAVIRKANRRQMETRTEPNQQKPSRGLQSRQ